MEMGNNELLAFRRLLLSKKYASIVSFHITLVRIVENKCEKVASQFSSLSSSQMHILIITSSALHLGIILIFDVEQICSIIP